MWGAYFSFGLIIGIGIMKAYSKFARGTNYTELRNNEESILQLIEDSKDVIYHFDVKPEMKHRYISPSLDKFLGEGIVEKALKNPLLPLELIHPDDYVNLNKKLDGTLDYSKPVIQRWKDHEGNYRWFEEYTTPIYENGELVAIQGVMRNIDEKIKLQRDLEYRIHHDVLTGIHNREYFESVFSDLNGQINTSAAIILCDLDELKYINDNFGHEAGDTLIKEAAMLLNQFNSDKVMVARIGGDEFVLLAVEKNEKEVEQLKNDILAEINKYNEMSTNRKIKLSIGSSYTTNSLGKMTELFSQADKNMYKDKMNRKRMLG